MSPRRRWILLTVVTCAVATPVAAQDSLPRVEIGTRLRLEPVALMQESSSGRVVLSTADSLGIQRRNGLLFLSRMELRRVQRHAGRSHASGALKGAGWGALATVGLIALGAMQDAKAPDDAQYISATGAAFLGGVFVIIPVTTLVGAVVGSDKWITVWEP